MKYTKEERMQIGKEIFQGEMTKAKAAVKYNINIYTARDYLRLYKASLLDLTSDESLQRHKSID